MEQFVYYLIVFVVGYLSGKSSKVVKQRITERRSEQLRKIAEEVVLYVRPYIVFDEKDDKGLNFIYLGDYGSGFEKGHRMSKGLLKTMSKEDFKVFRLHLLNTGKCDVDNGKHSLNEMSERAQKLISKVNGDKQ